MTTTERIAERKTLLTFRAACLRAANGNLAGFCGVVSLTVRGIFGGEITAGTVKGCRHYWNRLPDGSEVDLTSCQFGGDGLMPLKKGRKTRANLGELVSMEALLFGMRVSKELGRPK